MIIKEFAELRKNLVKGDVLKWVYCDGNGAAVGGGEGIVCNDLQSVVIKTAYDIYIVNITELIHSASRIWVEDNIFSNREFKLNVDKRIVMYNDKPLIINGIVQYR